MTAVDFISISDRLQREMELPYSIELPVLGISTRFETNSRYVYDLFLETFGGWGCLPDEVRTESRRLRVRIVVAEGEEGEGDHAAVTYECPDETRVVLRSPGSSGISDPSRCESVAHVTTALVADRAHFRLTVLESLTLALLSHFDRHPIHAAAIARNRRVVLLSGPSGTGKSTLAYAAHMAGFDVLGEDHVWVSLSPRLRVWGWPGRILLVPDAAAIFPEIAGLASSSNENGRRKLAYHLGETADVSNYLADEAVTCILDRRGTTPRLERLGASTLADALGKNVTPGFDRFPARHEAVVRELTRVGGWRLTLSEHPRDALSLLQHMLDEPAMA